MTATEDSYDVVVVGGGPTGSAVGVFAARYGLDVVVFDRGKSSLRRCGHLENYLGFPGGIDIQTFYELMHDHVEKAGCELVSDLVESVELVEEGEDGFVVETQDGRRVTTDRVVAATRYGGEYLSSLDDGSMFKTYEYGGDEYEKFDRSYAEDDGTTQIDGLYVAAPAEAADRQTLMAAGRGARVGITLLEDVREERGYPETIASQYDWIRREAGRTGEWSDRDRWREWFAEQVPDDYDLDEDGRTELREREIDRRFDAYLPDEEIERRRRQGHETLLEHIDDELILDAAREIRDERGAEGSDGRAE
ncbi:MULTISPECIES: FAD-dependent oxidoreductase [unclassified Haladaptatus]|uniref:FAD-dependent oxidoreductase n=1 Tax=unclassified Haladaptatus TaxID=2622732 RepID=UPI00209BBDED|nr:MULTISPECIES: FAD-dependent oxidoreductase [unclassified Haladaptatus]MCO8245807.1 FAD-dependent oxidoreductase [Haladaptatus sp. AB643]MCO8256154.1 FAD-dependent oxidoreductase [Haladaptatus sp. AB618]